MSEAISRFSETMAGWDQYHPTAAVKFSESDVLAAKDLLQNKAGYTPNKWRAILEEAITTSDFPYLFGQVIDRQMMARYVPAYADWRSYVKIASIPDFNTVYREGLYGVDNRLDMVPEKGEYLPSKPTNGRYSYHLNKYGRQFDISWESLVNDQLGAFQDIPQRFATAALRTEAYFVTSQYAASNGDGNTSLFGATITDGASGQAITNLGYSR